MTYQYPYGFSPQEATHEIDYGLTSRVKSKMVGWNWDVSTTYGADDVKLSTIHSGNQGLYAATGASPTDFYDGRLKATQWTSNLDLNRDFKVGLARPLNVAFGAEYPRDTYPIEAGSFAFHTLGGAASYQGFTPSDAGTHDRTNYAGYVDFAVKPRIVESGGIFGALGGTILDLSYQANKHLNLEIGTNKLFNRYPNQTNGTLLYYRRRAFDRDAVFIYPAFSPYGFDGGYYYIRARVQF